MNAYTDVFGGGTQYPSDVSYLALALLEDTTLEWPLEASTGDDIVARVLDVTPDDAALSITMPPADETAPGQLVLFINRGPDSYFVKDNDGGAIITVADGESWTVLLTDTSDAAGTWYSYQSGSVTSQAQAASLAGFGLTATGSTLSQEQDVTTFNAGYTAGAADRAKAYVWTGGLGTLTLTAAGTLGNGWFLSIRNEGAGNLTVDCSGADTINGEGTLTLRPADSCTINCDGASFYTVGLGQDPVFAFDFTSIDLTGAGATYTLSGAELNRIAYDFIGVLGNDVKVVVPATTQQYWVANDTTGGSFAVTLATAAQASPLNVARGARGIYYCQGSEVVNADTASIATPISVADGGTGATTASGARINLGGTATGIAVFTAASQAAGQSALGATATGASLFTAANVAAALAVLTPLTAKGDLFTFAAASTRLAVGTNGQVLSADSGETTGLKWVTGAVGSVTSVNASGGATGLTFSGGPITASGTLTLAGTLAVANGGTGITAFGTGVATALGQNVSGAGSLALTTSPSFVTPTLGVASATSLNRVTFTAPATGATLTLTDGKTLSVSNTLTFAGTDATTMTFPPASASVGYLNIPQNSKSAAYTTVATDSGKHIYHPASDANARTFTIDSNANVPYAIGTAITFVNLSANNVTIAITSDTMYLAGLGTTGSRTLAQYGMATALKIDSTTWLISGNGLT